MKIRGAKYDRIAREFYTTPSWCIDALLARVSFGTRAVWEPACSDGRMMRALADHGALVYGSDIEPVGLPEAKRHDFLAPTIPFAIDANVITNPPYGHAGLLARKFIERALAYTRRHKGQVAMLLTSDFDSAKTRKHLFGDCPAFAGKVVLLRRIVWIESEDARPANNHAWYHWDWRHSGKPVIDYWG